MNWDAMMVGAAFLGGSGVAGLSARYVLSETRKAIADLTLTIGQDRATLKLEIVKDREILIDKLNGRYVNRELCGEKHKRTTDRVDAIEKSTTPTCCPLQTDPVVGAWLKTWMQHSLEEHHKNRNREITD